MANTFNKIKKFDYLDSNDEAQILCLGFFDSIHKGHLRIINEAKVLAHRYNAKVSLFTFSNNPLKMFNNSKLVYTFDERCYVLQEIGVDYVYSANFDIDFCSQRKKEFLDSIISNKNIKAVVCGSDYTFGVNREGNAQYLIEYCSNMGIQVKVVDLVMYKNHKMASTDIRKSVKNGDINAMNAILSMPYIVEGVVVRGRGVGAKELVATANIEISQDKEKLGPGVYYTNVIYNGIRFRSVTNVGSQPTYNESKYIIETHILYFNKDIYDKKIIVEFIEKIRDVQKFENKAQLKEQILKDIQYVNSQNGGYDLDD